MEMSCSGAGLVCGQPTPQWQHIVSAGGLMSYDYQYDPDTQMCFERFLPNHCMLQHDSVYVII